jgi:hypothetical protein
MAANSQNVDYKLEIVGIAYGLPAHIDSSLEELYIKYVEEEDLRKPPWMIRNLE